MINPSKIAENFLTLDISLSKGELSVKTNVTVFKKFYEVILHSYNSYFDSPYNN